MESKRSWYNRETCCGVRVETGVFIFAIINAIIVTAVTISCLVFFGMMLWTNQHPDKLKNMGSDPFTILHNSVESVYYFVLYMISMVFLVIGVIVADVFAVVLCVGIFKKKPQYLKAYLIYGIINEVLSAQGIAFAILTEFTHYGMLLGSIIVLAICACVIYIFPLWLVNQAYMVLSSPRGQKKLINEQGGLTNEKSDLPLL